MQTYNDILQKVTDQCIQRPMFSTFGVGAKFSFLEAKFSFLEAKFSFPEAKFSLPEVNSSHPEAKSSLREAKCSFWKQGPPWEGSPGPALLLPGD